METSTNKKTITKKHDTYEIKENQLKEEIRPKEESKGKSQKVKVFISAFRYGDKIVSALGIPKPNANVEHRIPKSKLKDDELFNIISAMTNDKFFKNDHRYASVVKSALDKNVSDIPIPSQPANEISKKPIGKMVHEILDVEIELFIK